MKLVRMARISTTKNIFVTISLVILIALDIVFITKRIKSSGSANTGDFLSLDDIQSKNHNDSDMPSKSIEQKMKGVHLVENDNQRKGWELFSEEATGEGLDQWVLNKVKVIFYSEDNTTFTVSGDRGEIEGPTKNIIISGRVITQSENGYSFLTSDLKYDSKRKILYTENSVKMKGPPDRRGAGFNLSGYGMEIKVPTNRMQILKDVKADKMIDGKAFRLTSETSEFSSRSQEALFSRSVIMKYDKMDLQAPNAEFKYSKAKKMLSSIYAYDHVAMQDDKKSATCKELIIDLVQDQMTLRGSPIVKMGGDQIQGEEIIFYDSGRKMKISKMSLQRTGKGTGF